MSMVFFCVSVTCSRDPKISWWSCLLCIGPLILLCWFSNIINILACMYQLRRQGCIQDFSGGSNHYVHGHDTSGNFREHAPTDIISTLRGHLVASEISVD